MVQFLDIIVPPAPGEEMRGTVCEAVYVVEGPPVGDEHEFVGAVGVFARYGRLAEDWEIVSTILLYSFTISS